VDDIAAGVHTPRDGWCDPNGLLQGLRRKARALGVDYIEASVAAVEHDAHVAHGVRLKGGDVVAADHVVNAAGAWSQQMAAMVGMPLPIEPLRRFDG
jgi:glycine/D-amino acid oxidase-like deaminating enzyme